MKFTAEKNKLSDAIVNAAKASASKSPNPALEGILVNLKDDIITVTGYDLEMGIKSMIPVTESFEEGEIVLNAKVFGEMVRKMPSGAPVLVETIDETNVRVKSGTVEFSLVGISGQEYPNVTELSNDVSFTIKENVLKSMIRQTAYAIATNELKPSYMGSKFDIVDNVLNVVSIDGMRIARRVEPMVHDDLSFIAPAKTLNELLRILSDENTETDVLISIDRNQICVQKNDYMILSRLLEGSFIDYMKVMSAPYQQEVIVNVREFAESLDRTLLLVSDRFKNPVMCTFSNNKVEINCKTNIGKINDEIPVKYSGETFTIAFNAKFMIDALKNSECDEVKMLFSGPLAPIKIVPLGEENFTFLVLPIRQKA